MSTPEPPRPPAPPTLPTQALPVPPVQPRAGADVAQPVLERVLPELPPDRPWWDNPWPPIITGIFALIVGGLLGYAVGDRGETVTEAQRDRGPALTRTLTHTTTVVRPKVVIHTNTVTANTVTQTPAPANPAQEERRSEAEENLRRVERENEELKRQLEES